MSTAGAKYAKIAKYAQTASQIGNAIPAIQKYGSDDKLSREIVACAAAMALRDQGARRQVMAILRDAEPKVGTREAMLAAIQFNDREVIADVSEVFGVDLNNVDWCSIAARAGKHLALSWLIGKNAPASSVDGFTALSTLVDIPSGGVYWQFDEEHNQAIQLLGAQAELEKLSSRARVDACDALGRILAGRARPCHGFSKSNKETIVAAANALSLLWPMMSQKERASARHGARALLSIGADFGDLLCASPSPSGRRKGQREERREEYSKAKEWQDSLPALRMLESLAGEQDWLGIEHECQAQQWSLASAAMTWIENDRVLEPRVTTEHGFPVFEKLEKFLGRPIADSKFLFSSDGSRGSPRGMAYWSLSDGVGELLLCWLHHSGADEPDRYGVESEEILKWMECYAKTAAKWVDAKELPAPTQKPASWRAEKPERLENLLMPKFEQELMAWYAVCKSDGLKQLINVLANEWGSTSIEPSEARSIMAAWSEKIEMTIASFSLSPQSAARKKSALRV